MTEPRTSTKKSSIPEPNLEQIVDDFIAAVKLIEMLRGRPAQELIFHGPSRNLVATDPEGTFIAKYSIDPVRYEDELDNLAKFQQINEERKGFFKSVIGEEGQTYIGLPTENHILLDRRRVSVGTTSRRGGLYLFDPVQGDLLYDKILKGTATFDDFALATVQLARIMQEGKMHRELFGLRPVEENYYTDRFASNFLRQLTRYGNIPIDEKVQEEMEGNWSVLVASALWATQQKGNDGLYFDGQPKHHIYPTPTSIVSFDMEDKTTTPTLLGLASLLSYGLRKGGNHHIDEDITKIKPDPYINEESQKQILDRFLLELEFVVALNQEYHEKASRVFKHVKERYDKGVHDLISNNPRDNIYLILGGSGDREQAFNYRKDFLSAWPFAVLQRSAEWTGHKARWRALAERLVDKGIRFQIKDPVGQNAYEQGEHMRTIIATLDQLGQTLPANNGTHQPKTAAIGLYNRFSEIQAKYPQYFNPR